MKTLKLTSLFICLFLGVLNAQTIKHHDYTTYYNILKHTPDSVTWTLNESMLECGKTARKDLFHADPLIPASATVPDYLNSHYDKGHLFSYQDAECDPIDRVECFYMSNMLPQLHKLNGITWYQLEGYCRYEAMRQQIRITAGGAGTLGTIGKNKVNIPAICWKVIHFKDSTSYWIMPNRDSVVMHDFEFYKVTPAKFKAVLNHL